MEKGQQPSSTVVETENDGDGTGADVMTALLDKLPNEVTEGKCSVVRDLLQSYDDVFSRGAFDMGRTSLVEHAIDTGDHRPIRQGLRRHPIAHLDAIDQQLDELLRNDFIEPAASPWASNVVLVRKKDGSHRLCVDYRSLNSVTYKDAYPLPHIDTCLGSMDGAAWFSTLDLRSGYHNIPIREADRDKTAFVTRRGCFRYKVMPFGLTCAPSVFQRLMDLVLCGLTYESCLVYLDDIIVFSRNFDSHVTRLREVFERLRAAGLKLHPNKCFLFQRRVAFLGHVLSEDGIEVQAEKVETVCNWPTPQRLTDLRSFLGLCSYYRRFIPGFADIAAPLHALQRKNVRFEWTEQQETAFNELKARLTTAPVLGVPRDEGVFYLDTDASDVGLGAVLSQGQDGSEVVIAYASRTLSRPERNYDVTRRELLAVVYGLRTYKQYLLGWHFVMRFFDHAALQWLRRTPEPMGQQARWLAFMEQFHFDVVHRAGSRHGNADGLSRRSADDAYEVRGAVADGAGSTTTQSMSPTGVEMETGNKEGDVTTAGDGVSDSAGESLADLQLRDPDIGPVLRLRLQQADAPSISELLAESAAVKELWSQWHRLVVCDGVLYRQWTSKDGRPDVLQLLLPATLRTDFIRRAHTGMCGGHLGIRRTLDQIQRRAYCRQWRRDVTRYCRRCQNCNGYFRGQLPRSGPLQPMVTGAPFERLHVDLTGPHPRSRRGSVYIITCIEPFTNWAEAFPTPNKEASTVARIIVEQVICRYGCPIAILSDRGKEVDGQLITEICRCLDIDKLHTTSYKASTNAAVERFHRTLNSMMGRVVDEHQRHWDSMLPYVMAAYRSSRHEATQYSPNYLLMGREVRAPVDLVYGSPETTPPATFDDYAEELEDRLRRSYVLVRKHLGEAAVRSKRYYDLRVRPQEYKAGDWVYFYNPRRFAGRQDKWARKFSGPCLVVKQLGPVNLLLQRSMRQKLFCVHVDNVKPFVADEIPKSSICAAELHGGTSQLPLEERVAPVDEDVMAVKQGFDEGQRAVDEDVPAAIAGVPPEIYRSPTPRRRAGRPRRSSINSRWTSTGTTWQNLVRGPW